MFAVSLNVFYGEQGDHKTTRFAFIRNITYLIHKNFNYGIPECTLNTITHLPLFLLFCRNKAVGSYILINENQ